MRERERKMIPIDKELLYLFLKRKHTNHHYRKLITAEDKKEI